MGKFKFLSLGLLILASGCSVYDYKTPAKATLEDTFQNRKTDESDELLQNITELSLEDAQRIGLANNPTYQAAYHSVTAARMVYYQALGAYSPEVGVNFSLGHQNNWSGVASGVVVPDYTSKFYTQTNVTANLLLFDGFARYLSVKIAKSSEKYQQAMEEDACRLLLRNITYAYNEILLAKENMRIAEKDMTFQLSCLRESELKYEVGTVPLSEVLNFQIKVNNAANSKLQADFQYSTAVYALAVLMGYPEGKFPDWITFPMIKADLDAILPSVELYLDTALANRPDLRGIREQVKIAEYTKYKTYSAFSPKASAFVGFSYATNQIRYTNYSIDSQRTSGPGFEYGLSASWTIFNGFIRYNQMRESFARLAVAQFNAAAAWLNVISEVRTAYVSYTLSIKQAKLYEGTFKYSTEQRDLVAKEYEAGTIGITRLNEVQRDLVDAEATLASAYINTKNAKVQLEAASGMLSKQYYPNEDKNGKTVFEEKPTASTPEAVLKKAEAQEDSVKTGTTPQAAPMPNIQGGQEKQFPNLPDDNTNPAKTNNKENDI